MQKNGKVSCVTVKRTLYEVKMVKVRVKMEKI
jgi:hypothetical protein